MRSAAVVVVQAVLLALPTVLAFVDGGYFDGPRLVAAIVVWACVAIAALAGRLSVPRGAARPALAGLALLAAYTALSTAWAPLDDAAADSAERVVLFLGALL